MNQDFYIHRGIAYIPVLAKTEAGFYLQVDPAVVVEVEDTKSFETALKHAIARGNPIVPTPNPDALPEPDMHKRAGVKSWSQFEKEAAYWSAYEENGVFKFGPWKRYERRGWVPDPDRLESLPLNSSIDDFARRVVEAVQRSVVKKKQ